MSPKFKNDATAKANWLEKVRSIAKGRGGECLSSEYFNAHKKLKFRCRRNHIFDKSPVYVLRDGWCKDCAVIEQHMDQRTPYEKIKKVVRQKNGILLSTKEEYLDGNGEIKIRCDQGHEFKKKWGSLSIGSWCIPCGRKAAGKKTRLTIDIPQRLAQSRGGKLISTEYVGTSIPLYWRCYAGHEFLATYANVSGKRGTWCPTCAPFGSVSERIVRRYCESILGFPCPEGRESWLVNEEGNAMRFDGYNAEHRFAFEHHGTQHYIETKFYKDDAFKKRQIDDGTKEKLAKENGIRLFVVNQLFLKTDFDQLRSSLLAFAENHSIPTVTNAETICIDVNSIYKINPIEKLKAICLERGGNLLTEAYKGQDSEISIECNKHGIFKTKARNLLRGNWCRVCKIESIREKNTKYTIEDVRLLFRDRGIDCLSTEYRTNADPLDCRCRICGNEWKAALANVLIASLSKKGTGCPKCSYKRTADKQRGNIENIDAVLEKVGSKLVSRTYVNARTKMDALCRNGHAYTRTPDEFKNNPECPICLKRERMTESPAGENKRHLLNLAKSGSKRPNSESHIPEEKKLGIALSNYIKKDSDFKSAIMQAAPHWFDRVGSAIQAIWDYSLKYNCRPSQHSDDPVEWTLAQKLSSYMNPKKSSYRESFAREYSDRFPGRNQIYTLENCKRSAIPYSYRGEWKKAEPEMYDAAVRKKWLDECTRHMRKKYR
jgi:hypothetical protein